MKAVIIEDNINTVKILKKDLETIAPYIEITAFTDSVTKALNILNKNEIELIFLDVNLTDGTGFEILNQIEFNKYKIIFISDKEHHAVKAFRFSAIDYITKPININQLKEAIEKVNSIKHNQPKLKSLIENNVCQKVTLSNSGGLFILEINQILYIEAYGNYCKFHTTSYKQPILITQPLKKYIVEFKENTFIRTHSKYLVNGIHIKSFISVSKEILLYNTILLPVSQRKQSEVRAFIKKRL